MRENSSGVAIAIPVLIPYAYDPFVVQPLLFVGTGSYAAPP
jgi:hypothetical protein